MLSNSELRKAFGSLGRQRVEGQYNEEFVFERLTKYYRALGIN
ncbi:MAG: hypothetical protein ACKPB9_03610 [Dolichospermum sp.]